MSVLDDFIGRIFNIWPCGHLRPDSCWKHGRHLHLPFNRVWWRDY